MSTRRKIANHGIAAKARPRLLFRATGRLQVEHGATLRRAEVGTGDGVPVDGPLRNRMSDRCGEVPVRAVAGHGEERLGSAESSCVSARQSDVSAAMPGSLYI